MDFETQLKVARMYTKFKETDRKIINANLKNEMDVYINKKGITLVIFAKEVGVPLYTISQIRKLKYSFKPSFIVTLKICNTLNILLDRIMEPCEILPVKGKWDDKLKEGFVQDYNSLQINQVCVKYNITHTTAREYYRVFKEDI